MSASTMYASNVGINNDNHGQYPAYNAANLPSNAFQLPAVVNATRPSTPLFNQTVQQYYETVKKANDIYHLNLGKIPNSTHFNGVFARQRPNSVQVAPLAQLTGQSNGLLVEKAGSNSYNVRYYGQPVGNRDDIAPNLMVLMNQVNTANLLPLYSDPTYPSSSTYVPPPTVQPPAQPLAATPNPYARPHVNPYAREELAVNPYARPAQPPGLTHAEVMNQCEITRQLYLQFMSYNPNELPIFPVTLPGQQSVDYVGGKTSSAIMLQPGVDWKNSIESTGIRYPLGGDVTYNAAPLNSLTAEQLEHVNRIAREGAQRFQ
jgi:hypothetical protein